LHPIYNNIDTNTGCYLGHHFSLSVQAVAAPRINTDMSMNLNVICQWTPLQTILKPTSDHEKFYQPCIKSFFAKLANCNEDDLNDVNCEWQDNGNQKRGILQTLGGTPGAPTSSTVSLNLPASVVQRIYGPNSTSINSSSTTPNAPTGTSSRSTTPNTPGASTGTITPSSTSGKTLPNSSGLNFSSSDHVNMNIFFLLLVFALSLILS